jgi:Mrp family chromosome partitioning ATPase
VGELPATNPGELVASAEMEQLLGVLRSEADVVIVDGSPLLPVADTAVLAAMDLGVVLVAEVGKTRAGAIRQAQEILGRAQARVLGMALNRAPASDTSYPYPYDSSGQAHQRPFERLLRRS